jgi:hypothetical protein
VRIALLGTAIALAVTACGTPAPPVPRQMCGTIEAVPLHRPDAECPFEVGARPPGSTTKWYVAHPNEEVDSTDDSAYGEPLDDDFVTGEADSEVEKRKAKPKPTTTKPKASPTRARVPRTPVLS